MSCFWVATMKTESRDTYLVTIRRLDGQLSTLRIKVTFDDTGRSYFVSAEERRGLLDGWFPCQLEESETFDALDEVDRQRKFEQACQQVSQRRHAVRKAGWT